MTRRKDEGLTDNGGEFATKATAEADVDLSSHLDQRDRRTLQELLDFAGIGARLVARGRSAYDRDEMLRLAAEAILHRLGEAVARLNDEIVMANPQVNWTMKGMRKVVAQDYGAIDHHLVCNSLVDNLPSEAAEMRKIPGE